MHVAVVIVMLVAKWSSTCDEGRIQCRMNGIQASLDVITVE